MILLRVLELVARVPRDVKEVCAPYQQLGR